jgi:hypothetical protein
MKMCFAHTKRVSDPCAVNFQKSLTLKDIFIELLKISVVRGKIKSSMSDKNLHSYSFHFVPTTALCQMLKLIDWEV